MFPKGLIGQIGGMMVLRVYGWRPLAIYPRVEVDIRILIGFFKKWAIPGLFLTIYFRLFKHTLQFLQHKKCKKCPSSIRTHDLWNITTGPVADLINKI